MRKEGIWNLNLVVVFFLFGGTNTATRGRNEKEYASV